MFWRILVDPFFQNGRILVDTFGEFWWTKMDINVHENSSPWVNFRGHILGEF